MKRLITLFIALALVGIVQAEEKTLQGTVIDQDDDYIPFVAKWKQWHVLGFSVGPAIPYDYEFKQSGNVIDGKTYYPLYLKTGEGTNWEKSQRFYLFREEDRRVYLYDYETAQEHCVYDFTLEEGDTFDIGWGDEADRCVVTKVDYIDVKGSKQKTITFSSVNPADGCEPEHKDHTWVEGIGDLSQPIAGWKPNSYESSWSYHVAYMFMPEYDPDFYPFSFCSASNDNYWVIGQELVRGETIGREKEWEYEIIDGKLHVKGCWYLHPNSADYIYCIISPTEDHKTYTISTEIESMDRVETCEDALYEFDIYFDIPLLKFDDNYNFVVVDENGVEHPVPNRDKYHPFIEDGKVWKTGWVTMPGVPAFDVNYYYLEGDTVIKGELYQKLMRTNVTKERKVTVYNGALREEGKKVYYSGGLLYDFDAQIGDTLEVYGFPNTKAIIEKRDVVDLNGYTVRRTLLGVYGLDEENEYGIINHDAWYEGIGYLAGPCEGLDPGYPSGMYYNTLLSCTIYNDTLYSDARYTDTVSEYWEEDSETKKQKIDFTHVIKTKPTGPYVAAGISLVEGEYSDAVLNIDFEGMDGCYAISVSKDGEQQDRFSANQETRNLQSLGVNLAGYADGEYTVVVENDSESYTAHFVLPLEGTGIESIQNSKFKIDNHAPAYDLSGRRVSARSALKGVRIQGKRKVIMR